MANKLNLFGNITYDNVPKGILRDRRLTGANLKLYAYLCDFEEVKIKFNLEYKSQKEIAKKLHYSEKQINRAFSTLKNYGLIGVIKSKGLISEYWILDAAKSKFAEESQMPELFEEYTPKREEKSEEIKPVPVKIILTSEQIDLKHYIESKIGNTLTKNKIKILTEIAENNKEINEIYATIKNIVDTVIDYKNRNKMVITNIFGYIKGAIKRYTTPKKVSSKNTSPYSETAMSLSLKLQSDYEKRYHLTYKQCVALCSIAADKLYLTIPELYNFILFEIINPTRKNLKIRDMFRYLITLINNYNASEEIDIAEEYDNSDYIYHLPDVDEPDIPTATCKVVPYEKVRDWLMNNNPFEKLKENKISYEEFTEALRKWNTQPC